MGRNGIAFVAFMLVVAFLAGSLTLILGGIALLLGLIIAGKLALKWLSGGGSPSQNIMNIISQVPVMRQSSIPAEFDMLESFVLRMLRGAGDSSTVTMAKFLHRINVHDGSISIPAYLKNGVVMKMLFEYKLRTGNLNYPVSRTGLTPEDILRPLPDADKDAFHRFCLDTSL